MVEVFPVRAFSDNYIWMLVDAHKQYAACVDPGDAKPVNLFLEKQQLKLSHILLTHHHFDHTGGVASLMEQHQPALFGPASETLPCEPVRLVEGDKIQLETHQLELSILDLPGHTAGHIAYYGEGKLFCGDTLFACGCGRLFEGSPEQMHHSLSKLADLPDNTEIYCTHEYTQSNIQFALAVEPDNTELQKQRHWVEEQRKQDLPTLPSNIGLEKATNPFLRCREHTIKAAADRYTGTALDSPVAVFAAIRKWKDSF